MAVPVRVRVIIGLRTRGGDCSRGTKVLGTTFKCSRFRLTCPLGVWTIYDLGVSATETIAPRTGSSPEVIHTAESIGISGSGRTRCRFTYLVIASSY